MAFFDLFKRKDKVINEERDSWFDKGVKLQELKKFKEAIECYDKALEIDSRYIGAWYNKRVALADLKRFEEAIKCFDTVLKNDPDNEKARKYKEMLIKLNLE